jgi:hypothetical protein
VDEESRFRSRNRANWGEMPQKKVEMREGSPAPYRYPWVTAATTSNRKLRDANPALAM